MKHKLKLMRQRMGKIVIKAEEVIYAKALRWKRLEAFEDHKTSRG